MKETLEKAIVEALSKMNVEVDNIEISIPKEKENGDYSTNIAMKLAGKLKKNPLETYMIQRTLF